MKKLFENISATDIRNIIAILYVVLAIGYIYVLIWKPVPAENKDLINILGGTVIGGVGLILAYFFGASKSDDKKPNQ